ncbi:MAG: guanylate kinase [Lachnospiraceae bacterium]|nr:guanylate kinase [Lachnospiraceae bacterium]
MPKKGLLIVISGFSGVGKGTIVKELLKRYPDEFALSISATSRKIREGEQEGREYFFVSREKFEEMIENDRLLEHAVYNGNYYGTPKDYVLEKIGEGRNVILEIEVQGGLQIRDKFPDSLLLYVVPPSAKELYDRLIGRGTESVSEILRRMRRAVDEADYVPRYDEMTVNDDLEVCVNEVYELIRKKQEEAASRDELLARLKEELIEITKEDDVL